MLKLITFFIALIVFSIGFIWLSENPGEIKFNWIGYEIESSAAFLFILIIISFFLLSFLYQIFAAIVGIPGLYSRKSKKRAINKSLNKIGDSYAALLSGDVKEAKKSTSELKKINSDNLDIKRISKLLDAKISEEEGDLMIASHSYTTLLEDKNNEYFATKGLLDLAFKAGNKEESIRLAERAYELKPDIKNGAHSLLELYKKTDDLDKAEELLNRYKNKHLIFKDKNNNINLKDEYAIIWFHKGKAIYKKPKSERTPAELELAYNYLEKAHKNNPDNEEFLIAYVEVASELGKEKKIDSKVKNFWKKQQSYNLLDAYIKNITGKDEKTSLKRKLKALDQLEKINNDPSIDAVKNSLITVELN